MTAQALKQQLASSIEQAQRNQNKTRLSVLRGLNYAVQTYEKDNMTEITDEQTFLDIVKKEVKDNTDFIKAVGEIGESPMASNFESVEAFQKAVNDYVNKSFKVEERHANIAILQEFLPKQLAGEELYLAVSEVLSQVALFIDPKNPKKSMGQAMEVVKGRLGNQANGGDISKAVMKWLGEVK